MAVAGPGSCSSRCRDYLFDVSGARIRANLYFREASQLREIGSNDLAMPLLELAKQNYREILRTDSGHWDAKYNLELALILAPDTDPVDALEEVNPERSPRALTKIHSREPLP